MIELRVARKEDAEGMLSIYAPYVADTNVTFDYEVTEAETYCMQVEKVLEDYPWLIAENNGKIIGYTYARKHRERAAYQWCCESSVYVHEDYQGKGIAKQLYEALQEILVKQNMINMYAGIAQPNENSTMFHVRMGFTPVGVYKKVGFKNGQWHDVLWVHKTLIKHPANPLPVIKFSDPAVRETVNDILAAKTKVLNSTENGQ
jgi:L-amino acid N-acyltransferase YncA